MKNAFAIVLLAILGFAFAQENAEALPDDPVKEEWDGTIPWDAWVSWGVGGAIMLFVLFAIIWTVVPRCMKKES